MIADESAIASLRAERIERVAPTTVEPDGVRAWLVVFGHEATTRHDPEGAEWVVPPEMVTTFLRPAEPPPAGAPVATNVMLHERLKSELELPVGIAVGYELECHATIGIGVRMRSVERIAEVGDERDTRLGRGRDWTIEVVSSIDGGRRDGEVVCVERWRMFGYDPARAGGSDGSSPRPVVAGSAGDDEREWHASLLATREAIVRGAIACRVWAPAHHDDDAARAAGLPGILLDTSSWVALMARHARGGIGDRPRIGAVDLSMRRPVLTDDTIEFVGRIVAESIDDVDVRWTTVAVDASVDGREVASALVRFAVATADGTDVWNLTGDRWRP